MGLAWEEGARGRAWRDLFKGHGSGEMGEDDYPELVESWSTGQGDVKVVRVPVNGMIMLDQDAWYSGNAVEALRAIRRATRDEEVSGLLLEVDSGGGGITDSDIIYKALKNFKAADEKRVIVACMGSTAASGAYYISLAADKIIAHPTTLTGSIGVIMQSYNVKELAAKLGVSDVTIKSGANKDLLNPFQEVKPEQQALLQKVVTSMHGRFVSLVAENRALPLEVVAPLADGRVFVASEALEHKLIDGIGYFEDARRELANLLEVEDVKVFRYEEQMGLFDLFTRKPTFGLDAGLGKVLLEALEGRRQLMYRWSW